jgi:hypothetical protein
MDTTRFIRWLFLSSALCFTSVIVVRAIIVPTLDLDALTADATIIALGEVTSIKQIGSEDVSFNDTLIKTRVEMATIRVDQILKGTAPTGVLVVRFHLSETPVGWGGIASLAYGVFFLKSGRSEAAEFTNLYYPLVLSVPGAAVNGDRPIDRVVSAVGRVLESTHSTASERMNAVFTLSRSKSAASTAALRAALRNPSVEGRLSAAGALLERNDITGLDLTADSLLHGSPDTSLPLYHNVLYGISEGVKDVHAVPVLKTLLDSRDSEIRRAAASALMHTQSQDAIGPLLTTLQDSDFDTRYYSAVGLAEITGQTDWRPNEEDFRSDQAKYLKHWREWASSQRN